MKTIPLQKFVELLQDAEGAILLSEVGKPILYPSIADLTGDEENEFLYFSWESEDLTFSVKFAEGENQEVEINELEYVTDKGTIFNLTDTDGGIVEIILLKGLKYE